MRIEEWNAIKSLIQLTLLKYGNGPEFASDINRNQAKFDI